MAAMRIAPACAGSFDHDAQADRTLSPYFFVHSDESGVDRLPLESTDVSVTIAGVITDVTGPWLVITTVVKREEPFRGQPAEE